MHLHGGLLRNLAPLSQSLCLLPGIGAGLLQAGPEVRQVLRRIPQGLHEAPVDVVQAAIQVRHAEGDRCVHHQGPEAVLAGPQGRQRGAESLPLAVVGRQDHPEDQDTDKGGEHEARDQVQQPGLTIRERPDPLRMQLLDRQQSHPVRQVQPEQPPAGAALEEDHEVHGGSEEEHGDAALGARVAKPDQVQVPHVDEEQQLHAVVAPEGGPVEPQGQHSEAADRQVHEGWEPLRVVEGHHHQDGQQPRHQGEPPEQPLLDGGRLVLEGLDQRRSPTPQPGSEGRTKIGWTKVHAGPGARPPEHPSAELSSDHVVGCPGKRQTFPARPR